MHHHGTGRGIALNGYAEPGERLQHPPRVVRVEKVTDLRRTLGQRRQQQRAVGNTL
jgi:hypothetical protein